MVIYQAAFCKKHQINNEIRGEFSTYGNGKVTRTKFRSEPEGKKKPV
jgi:hypothetical protein